MTKFALVGDVGGTNARLALCDIASGEISRAKTYSGLDYPSLEAVVRVYLNEQAVKVDDGCIAIACPITGDWVAMTNHTWAFSIAEMKKNLGFAHLEIINDFTAVSMAIPMLKDEHLIQFGARNAEEADQTGAVLVLSLVFAEFVNGAEISQGAGEPVLVGDLHRVFDTIERHGELRHHAFDKHSVEVHAVVPHVEVASVALLNLPDRRQKVVRDRLVLHLPHFSGRVVDGITPQKDFCLRVFSVLMSTEFDRRLAEGL